MAALARREATYPPGLIRAFDYKYGGRFGLPITTMAANVANVEKDNAASAGLNFPFTLTIIVHKATDLAIADLTSSDPYVIVRIGDRNYGQTQVKKRNLNPEWNEQFEIKLMHTAHVIKFMVYDEDLNSAHDFMGVVQVDMKLFAEFDDTYIAHEQRAIEAGGNVIHIQPQGSLFFSIALVRNAEIIKLVYSPTSFLQRPQRKAAGNGNSKGRPLSDRLIDMRHQWIEDELTLCNLLGKRKGPITALNSPLASLNPIRKLLETLPPPLRRIDLIRDLLADVSAACHHQDSNLAPSPGGPGRRPSAIAKAQAIPMSRFNTSRRSSSSTVLSINSRYMSASASHISNEIAFGKTSPVSKVGLRFYCKGEAGGGGEEMIDLLLPNKYCAYIWLRWVTLALRLWKDGEDDRNKAIPRWATDLDNELSTNGATLSITSNYLSCVGGKAGASSSSSSQQQQTMTGTCRLNLDRDMRYTILCENAPRTAVKGQGSKPLKVSIANLDKVVLFVDAVAPRSHMLQIEIGHLDTSQLPSSSSSSSGGVGGEGHDFYAIFRSDAGHFHKTRTITSSCEAGESKAKCSWKESVYIDVSVEETNGGGFVDLLVFQSTSASASHISTLANALSEKETGGVLVGQSRISYKALFPSSFPASLSSSSSPFIPPLPDDDVVGEEQIFALQAPIEMTIKLVQYTPKNSAYAHVDAVFVKCVAVDWDGKTHKPSSGNTNSTEPLSVLTSIPSYTALTGKYVWSTSGNNSSSLTFHQSTAAHNLATSQYIKMRIISASSSPSSSSSSSSAATTATGVANQDSRPLSTSATTAAALLSAAVGGGGGGGASSKENDIGIVYIPFSDFPEAAIISGDAEVGGGGEAREYLVYPKEGGDEEKGIGTIKVTLQRGGIRSVVGGGGSLSFAVRTKLSRVSEYNSFWPVDCLTTSSVVDKVFVPATTAQMGEPGADGGNLIVEKYQLAPGYEGLILNDVNEEALVRDRPIRSESQNENGVSFFQQTTPLPPAQGQNGYAPVPLLPPSVELQGLEMPIQKQQLNRQESYGVREEEEPEDEDEDDDDDKSKEITKVLREHQRRKYFPPFKWSKSSLMSCIDPPRFTDDDGSLCYFESPQEVQAPAGYEWVEDWKKGKWCYGSSFSSSLVEEKTKGAGGGCGSCVRRREWTRVAAPLSSRSSYRLVRQSSETDEARGSEAKGRASSKGVGLGILKTCKERLSPQSPKIIIPWSQVTSCDAISPSVVALQVVVNRALFHENGSVSYTNVTMEIFVVCCPAFDLCSLISERRENHEFRLDLYTAMLDLRQKISGGGGRGRTGAERGLPCEYDFTKERNYFLVDTSEEEKQGHDLGDDDTNPLDIRLDLESLELTKELDTQIATLSLQYEELKVPGGVGALQERVRRMVLRNMLRKKLYVGALFGVLEMPPLDYFDPNRIMDEIKNEFEHAEMLGDATNHSNEVSKENKRTLYLLRIAEVRLRYYALRGYDLPEGVLEGVFGDIINEFFVVLVSKYAKFFDPKVLKGEKFEGLSIKMAFIKCLLRNDTHLSHIAEGVLRPYGLSLDPQPNLSAFLKFETIIAWYSNVLHEELNMWMDKTISQKKKYSRQETTDAKDNSFTSRLPWYPETPDNRRPIIKSSLPKDALDFLKVYRRTAQISEKTVAEKFRPLLWMLDAKVWVFYAEAFYRLAKAYWFELTNVDWASEMDGEDLSRASMIGTVASQATSRVSMSANGDLLQGVENIQLERVLWLCSVGNDAAYVISNELMMGEGHPDISQVGVNNESIAGMTSGGGGGGGGGRRSSAAPADQSKQKSLATYKAVVDRVKYVYERVELVAMDHMSCIFFTWSLSTNSLGKYTSVRALEEFVKRSKEIALAHGMAYSVDSMRLKKSSIPDGSGIQGSLVEEFSSFTRLEELLEDYSQNLAEESYLRLLQISADKSSSQFLFVLKEAANQKLKFSDPESRFCLQLMHDMTNLEMIYTRLAKRLEDEEYEEDERRRAGLGSLMRDERMSSHSFKHTSLKHPTTAGMSTPPHNPPVEPRVMHMHVNQMLSHLTSPRRAVELITSAKNSERYRLALCLVVSSATEQPHEAEAQREFLRTCLSLRNDIGDDEIANSGGVGGGGGGSGGGGGGQVKRFTIFAGKKTPAATSIALPLPFPIVDEDEAKAGGGGSTWDLCLSRINAQSALERLALIANKHGEAHGKTHSAAASGGGGGGGGGGAAAAAPHPALAAATPIYHELANVSPVVRVFGLTGPFCNLDIDTILLHSANHLPLEEKGRGSKHHGDGERGSAAGGGEVNANSRASVRLGRKTPGAGSSGKKGSSAKKKRSWFGFGNSKADAESAKQALASRKRESSIYDRERERIDGEQVKIVLTTLRANDLLYTTRFNHPVPFLQLEFNGKVLYKSLPVESLNPVWVNHTSHVFSLPAELLTTESISCVLYHHGKLYGDDKMAVCYVSLSDIDIEPKVDCIVPLNYALTERGKKAAAAASSEGRSPPSIQFSLHMVDEEDDETAVGGVV